MCYLKNPNVFIFLMLKNINYFFILFLKYNNSAIKTHPLDLKLIINFSFSYNILKSQISLYTILKC